MSYKVTRIQFNEQLINIICSATKHSYKQVTVYFYSLVKLVTDDAIKSSKARFLKKKVQRTYPGTEIPFTLDIYSFYSRGGFANDRDDGVTINIGAEVKFPNKKKLFYGTDTPLLEQWASELIEAEIGLTDQVVDIDYLFSPLKQVAPKNLKHKL